MKKRVFHQLGLGAGGLLVVGLFFLITAKELTIGRGNWETEIAIGLLLIAAFLFGFAVERLVVAATIRKMVSILVKGNVAEARQFVRNSDFRELAPTWEELLERTQQLSRNAEREESTDKALLASIGEE